MRSYHAFAWKQLKVQKVTYTLIIIAIILSTMMTTVIGQSLGILQSLREQQAGRLNGYRYATFHNVTKEQKTLFESDERLSYVGSNITLGQSKLKNSGISLQLREYDEQGLSVYPMVSKLHEGRLPEKAGEIALPEDALSFLGLNGKLGDVITLDLSISLLQDIEPVYEYKANFILSGILESNYLGYISGSVTGIAGIGSSDQILPERYRVYSTDIRTSDKGQFQKIVYELADKLGINEKQIQYNWLYLGALGISYDKIENASSENGGFSYMAVTGILIGALVLLAAGLVIYNILKIAVSKRIKEYGILRAIGGEKGQLYLLVSEQILLLCIIGIPLGSVLGILSASAITKAAVSVFSAEMFMVQNTKELNEAIIQNSTYKLMPLILSALITLVFAFIAAIPSARYAARVSPTVAMGGNMSKIKRKNRKFKTPRSFEGFYARLNLRRNIGRTAITLLSLIMSITVFVALQAFSKLLDTSQEVQKLHLGDYSITNDIIGFDPAVVEALRAQKGIAAVATLKYINYIQDKNGTFPIQTGFTLKPGETLHIIGVDEERLKTLVPTLTNEDIQALKRGEECLITNPIAITYQGQKLEASSFSQGDVISIAKKKLKVLGNTAAIGLDNQGFINGIQVVVFDTIFDELTTKITYSELYLFLSDDADKHEIEQKLEETCKQTAGSRWLSYQNTDKQLEESFEQIKLLAWGLIFFIGLIGLLNIINTTYTNIHTRIVEIGIQRAIGMSTRSLYKTFLWESAYYGIIASVIGAVAGYLCAIFIGAAITEKLKFVTFPIIAILQAAVASIVACLIATLIPLGKISKMSIVNSIENVE
jgi:ABC-type antimicrobial peptide transport system permease subunit